MDVLGMDHVGLIVADVERSKQFYGTVLGIDEVPRPASFTFPGAWFRRGRAEFHLIGEGEAGRAGQVVASYRADEMQRGYATHIALEVADIEAAQAHLAAQGVPLVGGPQQRGDGVTQLYILDPDGYIIELFAWTKG
ncbi:MAG: VOC family protein [Chloroflexaceae bacterium]|nr:VOC family protein [Chloroflexaceae bacterium]